VFSEAELYGGVGVMEKSCLLHRKQDQEGERKRDKEKEPGTGYPLKLCLQ
jgi:hypothetical protein